jgi:hypothetical protein
VLGRRTGLLVWSLLILVLLLVQHLTLGTRWALVVGAWIGAAAMGWLLLPEIVMPGWIGNWQIGGWGEENTASELKSLQRAGWTVRHDLATSTKANIDHFVVGPSAYALDSKNLKDSTVAVEGVALRVTRIDDPESGYLLDWFRVKGQASRLERAIEQSLGFPVQVQPVLVIWGDFKEQEAWLGNLAVVHGMHLAAWLEARPRTLVREDKRQALIAWAERLRSA